MSIIYLFVTTDRTETDSNLYCCICLQQLFPKSAASNFNLLVPCLYPDLVSGPILYQYLEIQLIFLPGLTTMCLPLARYRREKVCV